MHGVRAIMSRVFYYAEGHGLWEEGRRSPASKARLGKKRYKRERRIFSFEETARVLARLEEPNRLIIETCIATGARISEVLGLKWKHIDFNSGTIKIEQRNWHQDIDRPKSEDSRRTLGIGDLVPRFEMKAGEDGAVPEAYISNKNVHAESRFGILASAMPFTKRPKLRAAIFRASGHTPSEEQISPGGKRLAAAPSRRRKSLATAIWR